MPTKTVEKVTTEKPVVGWRVSLVVAVVLALGSGALARWKGPDLGSTAVAGMAEFCVVVAAVMFGAGLGLSLVDIRTQTTKETTTTEEGIAASGADALVTKSLEVVKDLTPGKTLIVLAVGLLALSLWAITPAKPDTQVTVPSTSGSTTQ